MSKDHPHNGPSLSKKPPLKKRKLMTDTERAAFLDRKAAKLEEAKRDAAKSRGFHKEINKKGLYEALREANPDLNWKPSAKKKS